ncbi:MAG: hypothetical protein FWD27_09125, partial [Coriobacteriia bacterium]|nr:hypothetical protein [Coriobacteriia bacterium]
MGGVEDANSEYDSEHDSVKSVSDSFSESFNNFCETGDFGDAKVFINGKEYNNWEEVKKYGKKKHGIASGWMMFPFPLVVIVAYILLGVF